MKAQQKVLLFSEVLGEPIRSNCVSYFSLYVTMPAVKSTRAWLERHRKSSRQYDMPQRHSGLSVIIPIKIHYQNEPVPSTKLSLSPHSTGGFGDI